MEKNFNKKVFYFVIMYWDVFGGTETYTYTMCKELKKLGHEVNLVVTDEPYNVSKIDQNTFSNWYGPNDKEKLEQQLNSQDKSLINAVVVYTNSFQEYSKMFVGCNVILQHHFNIELNQNNLEKYFLDLANRYTYSKLGFLTENYEKNFLKLFPKFKNLTCTTYNGFENNFAKIKLEEKKNKIVYVGSLERDQKNPEMVFKIANELAQTFPNYEIELYGNCSNEKEKLVNFPNVKIMGMVDDLTVVYKESKLLFLTSNFEGFPRVIIEAQEFGVPCVSFNTFSACPEMLISGLTGETVRPWDNEQFIIESQKIINNYETYFDACQENFKKYLITGVAKQLIESFESVKPAEEHNYNMSPGLFTKIKNKTREKNV